MKVRDLFLAAALSFACGSVASAQVVLNEIWENPPNGGDNAGYEYIEIYGPPNYDLTGYLVAAIKGTGEIDEAFTCDGWKTDANGLFVLHGQQVGSSRSGLQDFGTMVQYPACGGGIVCGFNQPPSGPGQCYKSSCITSLNNIQFKNGAPFLLTDINIRDFAGKLDNDGSSTYLLIRRREHHVLNPDPNATPTAGDNDTTISIELPGYSWAKDFEQDLNLDSRLDFGDETNNAHAMQPVQIVDEISWSNDGQFEYNIPGRGLLSDKISETPGFNPDAVSRVRYLGANPLAGWTIDKDNDAIRTSIGDESWIYGENLNVNPGHADYGKYKSYYEDANGVQSTTNRAQRTFGAPTNLAGHFYNYVNGTTSPAPIYAPFFDQTPAYSFNPAQASQLFEPYNIQGFKLTPGAFNDAPQGSALIGTPIQTQFRFVRGDFNFDGQVTCIDRQLIEQAAIDGWTLDDRETKTRVDANGNPIIDSGTGQPKTFQDYKRQVQTFNGTLAMMRMSLSDGSTGEWTSGRVLNGSGQIVAWGGAVTPQDLVQFDAEFPNICVVVVNGACCTGPICSFGPQASCAGTFQGASSICVSAPLPSSCCVADFNNSSTVTVNDIFGFLSAWFGGSLNADANHSGTVTVNDIFFFLSRWFAGC